MFLRQSLVGINSFTSRNYVHLLNFTSRVVENVSGKDVTHGIVRYKLAVAKKVTEQTISNTRQDSKSFSEFLINNSESERLSPFELDGFASKVRKIVPNEVLVENIKGADFIEDVEADLLSLVQTLADQDNLNVHISTEQFEPIENDSSNADINVSFFHRAMMSAISDLRIFVGTTSLFATPKEASMIVMYHFMYSSVFERFRRINMIQRKNFFSKYDSNPAVHSFILRQERNKLIQKLLAKRVLSKSEETLLSNLVNHELSSSLSEDFKDHTLDSVSSNPAVSSEIKTAPIFNSISSGSPTILPDDLDELDKQYLGGKV